MKDSKIFQEIDALQVIKQIGKSSKRAQAKILQKLELSMDKNSEEYSDLRKLILDELNGLNRSVIREIFGEIEYLIK